MHKFLTAFIATAMSVVAAPSAINAEEVFVKELTFPSDATPEMKIEMASRLVPSPTQRAWQDFELTAFLHFGMNTFTDREWGEGNESPELFNPSDLDTDQWVKALQDAGFKMVILTAKHHDGFCLWPTATTSHSVASSPWLDGKGDIVRMLRKSCDKYGMKMGVYLSPWDRNAKCYGDSPAYNDMFAAQLTELLSNYGRIDEVWFDGACGEGPNGKKQIYDWQRFRKIMETLQPEAVLAIMGDDVRWVGNERGQGRETEWSVTALTPGIYADAKEANERLGLTAMAKDLGSRDLIARAEKLYWWPSEVDVSIRPGWFYHDSEAPKSLRELAEIYLTSVGRNSVLLLNIPPDRKGHINGRDVARLRQWRNWIDNTFSNNMLDADGSTIKDGPVSVNCVVLGEDIDHGQRVEEFSVEALTADGWKEVASGTTIGKKRILSFPGIRAEKLRLNVKSFRGDRHYAAISGAHMMTLPGDEPDIAADYRAIPTDEWRFASLGDMWQNPRNAFDGDPSTLATTAPGRVNSEFVIDLGSEQKVSGFSYLPPEDAAAGRVFTYNFFTYDESGRKWILQPSANEFSNITNNPIERNVYLAEPVTTRYVMLLPLREAEGGDKVSIAEFKLLTKIDN